MIYIKLFVIIFAVFLLLQGCGKKEGQSDSQAPKDEQTSSSQASGEQTGNVQSTLEIKEGFPDDFPKDIPRPENIRKIKYIDNNTNKIVIIEADVPIKDAINYYKENMKKNGFELNKNDNLIEKDDLYNADWKKEKRIVNIAITYQNSLTNIVITY